MRIELPRETERFGANLFYGPQKVYELDSGRAGDPELQEQRLIVNLPYEQIYDIQQRMAIVVPVLCERVGLIEGVLFGIPNQCFVIVVSNSPREPVDRFRMEKDAVCSFARFARKRVLVVHQKDPALARAFADAGYPELLDETDRIRDGKAEGMILGTVLAHLAKKQYVGFVDADNFFPGAVFEYVREYTAGLALSRSPYAMVRILWQSKPKVRGTDLYFAKWGRTSRVTNRFLNDLIGAYTGFETEVIRTGNAGEHALTLDLALRLDYAPGYSVEAYHFVSLLEKFGGVRESPFPEVMPEHVEVFQIESRNPHLHQEKGDRHIADMILNSLRPIHESFLCPEPLKRQIEQELRERGLLAEDGVLEPGRYYPAPMGIDFDALLAAVAEQPCSAALTSERAGDPWG